MGRVILNGIIFDNENYLGSFTDAISTWYLVQQRNNVWNILKWTVYLKITDII
jgi:hypothetical protein